MTIKQINLIDYIIYNNTNYKYCQVINLNKNIELFIYIYFRYKFMMINNDPIY